jgi:hypothetical protein
LGRLNNIHYGINENSSTGIMPTYEATGVPGTIYLVNVNDDHAEHGRDIVLHPQPSADPSDPLNWSRKRKLWNITMVYIYVLGVGIATTVQYSILTNISAETGVSLADLNTGTGLMFLFAGYGLFFPNPICISANICLEDGVASSGNLSH